MKNKTDKFEALFDKHFVKMGLREGPKEVPAPPKEEEKKQEELPVLAKRGSKKAASIKEEVKKEDPPVLGKRASKEAAAQAKKEQENVAQPL